MHKNMHLKTNNAYYIDEKLQKVHILKVHITQSRNIVLYTFIYKLYVNLPFTSIYEVIHNNWESEILNRMNIDRFNHHLIILYQ